MDKKQKMIFWDFGNVISKFSVDMFLENIAFLFNTSPLEVLLFMSGPEPGGTKPFLHVIESDPHWNPYNIFQAFCCCFRKQPRFNIFLKMFNKALEEEYEHSGRFLKFSRRIQEKGYYQGLISNANAIHAAKMENELGYLLEYIPKEFRYYSWNMYCRKSEDPRIFNKIFSEMESLFQIQRQNIVFMDDRIENIEGCRKAGANAIEFNIGDGLYRLEKNLQKIGFCV